MAKLTAKDYEILEFIQKQIVTRGFPPTVREICDAVGLKSTATIHARLKKLEEHGKIVKDISKNRSIRLTDAENGAAGEGNLEYSGDKYIDVPIYGNVAAGLPILAVQDNTDTFPLPMDFAHNRDLFMLKVKGDSMIEAAILDGDMIIVERCATAANGDIVVALVDNENATVKTFYKENGHFRLQPENSTMEPIIVNEVSIIGKVVGVFRKL